MHERSRFVGRTVVVTGGGGGIGSAVCEAFAREGASIAVVDLDKSVVDETVSQLRALSDSAVIGYVLDVRDSQAVSDTMRQICADLSGIDCLVALAGGSLGTPSDLGDIRSGDIDLVIDVNVKGTLYCCQAVVPYMKEAGRGAIITTSSIGGRQPSPVTGVPYASAKAGLLGLTRRLAKEVGADGIRVNSIAPGLFLTDRLKKMYDSMEEADRRSVLDAIPLNRFPEVREVVDPILFLASDEASYITGVTLDVNGGRFMPL